MIQVIDSMPWVRCASGNVFFVGEEILPEYRSFAISVIECLHFNTVVCHDIYSICIYILIAINLPDKSF